MKRTMIMDTKNSTSMTKTIFMIEKALYTTGKKYERPVRLYMYDPTDSTFKFFDFYGRIRDCLRGMQRICNKTHTDFRVVYLS